VKKEIKLTGYTPEEEQANFWTHIIGVIYGLIGLIITVINTAQARQLWSTLVFFATVMILYASSSLYHYATAKKQKQLFKTLDHISIYLLIAGTFTPFCFGLLSEEPIGLQLGIAIWGIALLGTLFKVFFTGKYEAISLISYLGMGWLGYLMFDELGELAGSKVVNYLLYGGLSYTIGVVFYIMRKLKYHHAIWHVFVLGGTVFHSLAIYSL